jgi:phytanoyl-CoA hydroxylase
VNTEVTSQQIQQYRSQGYLVLDNFLTPSELEHWRKVTEDAVNARLADNNTDNNRAI